MKKDVNVVREFVKNNKIFTATFIKKDGTVRVMNCRRGVKKGVTGAGMNYDPYEKNLLPVYDMQKGGFRMININTITELKGNGQTISFNE
jgi:hypothetical protein